MRFTAGGPDFKIAFFVTNSDILSTGVKLYSLNIRARNGQRLLAVAPEQVLQRKGIAVWYFPRDGKDVSRCCVRTRHDQGGMPYGRCCDYSNGVAIAR